MDTVRDDRVISINCTYNDSGEINRIVHIHAALLHVISSAHLEAVRFVRALGAR